jgi:hypothetical protein
MGRVPLVCALSSPRGRTRHGLQRRSLVGVLVKASGATKIERRISSHPDVLTSDGGERTSRCENATVTEQTLARARAGNEDAFRELTDP